MKKKNIINIMLVILLAASVFTGCSNTQDTTAPQDTAPNSGNTNEETAKELEGQILALGSSAMQPLVEEAANMFMSDSPNVQIQVQGGGSGTGLSQVSEGSADIGNSDIFAEEKDGIDAGALVDHKICVVGMGAVAHPEVGVDNLTKQQLIDIFTGKITNWKDVGGADQEITLVNRPKSSGTRATFYTFALDGNEEIEGIQEESSGTVKQIIGETPGAIGYLAFSYYDDTIKVMSLDGVEANEENVTNGTYPVWAYQHSYTKGEPNEVSKAFLDFMKSDDFQNDVVPQMGYIAETKMQVERDADGKVMKKDGTEIAQKLQGQILALGSSAMQPLVEEAANMFMGDNPDVQIQVQGGGSGTGLSQVSEGTADIGNSDIFAEEKDGIDAAALVDHKICVVGMGAVAHPEVGVDNLTKQQLIDIFTGKITNWKDAGGADQEITVVNRPKSSGTRATFYTFALDGNEEIEGIQEESSGTVRQIISETPGAIGYLAFSYYDDTIKALSLDGVEANEENVINGTFPVWAYEHSYTKGEPNKVTKAFLEFMKSDDFQNDIVPQMGYIAETKMKVERDAEGNVTNK